MRTGLTSAALAAALGWVLIGSWPVRAQQVTIQTPFHSLGDSFFENMGTSWRLSGPNWNFSFGTSPTQAAPQFGGFDPTAGGNFGFAIAGRKVNGQFNANLSQGYRQNFVTQTPVITLPQGGTGFVSDTSQTPFVISYIPVVGAFQPLGVVQPVPVPQPMGVRSPPAWMNPEVIEGLRQRAAQRDAWGAQNVQPEEVAEIQPRQVPQVPQPPAARRVHEDLVLIGPGAGASGTAREPPAGGGMGGQAGGAAQAVAPPIAAASAQHVVGSGDPSDAADPATQGHAISYFERGKQAEASGKRHVARIYYEMALRRASGPLKDEVAARMRALEAAATTPRP